MWTQGETKGAGVQCALVLLLLCVGMTQAWTDEWRCYESCVLGCIHKPSSLPDICEDCCDEFDFINVSLKQ